MPGTGYLKAAARATGFIMYNSHNSSCIAAATQKGPDVHPSRQNATAMRDAGYLITVALITTALVTNFCPQELCARLFGNN
jgi:hypothetical protein